MDSYLATLLADHRRRRRVDPARAQRARFSVERRVTSELARSEDGLLLIEVVISALIVGLIVVGTFTGLNVAQSTSISEREHNAATALAAESQEALRTAPASAFDSPSNNYIHEYTKAIDGETYTVTQKASFLNSSGESTACSATNTTRQETNSVKLTSIVRWPQQVAGKRAPVTVSSVATPPAASALEVDVGNYPTPTAGVSGMPTAVKYVTESSPSNSMSGTTEAGGCVVYAALPTTAATVEVGEISGYITPSGEWKTVKEVTIAPNYTMHYPVTFNRGGAIQAEFSYNGSTSAYTHPGNSSGTISEPVTVDAFVAYNELMESPPNLEVGSSKYANPAGTYTNTFGTTEAATWAHTITTPLQTTKYPNGNLFPFPTPGAWKVYAGACAANDPHVLNSTLTDPTGYVTAAGTTPVTVPTAYMKLTIYSGKKSAPTLVESTAYPVLITNTGCKKLTPDDGTEFNEPKEKQETTTSTTLPGYGGHLTHPFLPLGPGRLCVGPYTSSGKQYTFTTPYTLTNESEYKRNIYLGELPGSTESKYEETIGSEHVEVTVAKASACT